MSTALWQGFEPVQAGASSHVRGGKIKYLASRDVQGQADANRARADQKSICVARCRLDCLPLEADNILPGQVEGLGCLDARPGKSLAA